MLLAHSWPQQGEGATILRRAIIAFHPVPYATGPHKSCPPLCRRHEVHVARDVVQGAVEVSSEYLYHVSSRFIVQGVTLSMSHSKLIEDKLAVDSTPLGKRLQNAGRSQRDTRYRETLRGRSSESLRAGRSSGSSILDLRRLAVDLPREVHEQGRQTCEGESLTSSLVLF